MSLVFPDNRNPLVYRHLQELYILNDPFLSATLVEEKTGFFRYNALLSHHNMFRLHCGGWGIDRLLPIRTNRDYETAPKNCIVCAHRHSHSPGSSFRAVTHSVSGSSTATPTEKSHPDIAIVTHPNVRNTLAALPPRCATFALCDLSSDVGGRRDPVR